MNNRILTIAAVLAASLIAGVFATTPMGTFADGDSSETNTEQSIKKKNLEAMDQPTSTVEITTLTAVLS